MPIRVHTIRISEAPDAELMRANALSNSTMGIGLFFRRASTSAWSVPLRPTWQAWPDELRSGLLSIYRSALQRVSGIGRTAHGAVMSASPGKVAIDGMVDLDRGPAFALRILQARRPELVGRPLFAAYDPHAQWWDELRPYGVRDRDFLGPGTTIEAGAA